MRRWVVLAVVAGVTIVLAGSATAAWYVHDRTGPRDATTAGQRLRADVRILVSELGLREVQPEPAEGTEECGVWDGSGDQLSREPRRQHRAAVTGLPPPGQAASGLAPEAEEILGDLGYRIITEDVDFAEQPPPGIVIAAWGWSDVLEITVWPDPDAGTVRVSGMASCLPG